MATNASKEKSKKAKNQEKEITYENREIMFDRSGH